MNRRTFVAATGVTLTSIGLAGCTGEGGADDGSGSGDAGGSGEITETNSAGDTPNATDSTDTSSAGDTTETTETDSSGTPSDDEFELSEVEGALGDEVSEYVEVTEHHMFQTVDDIGVTGVVENTSGERLELVEAEVTLKDGDTVLGEFIDTSDEEVTTLGPGKQWRFWVTFEDEELTPQTSYTITVQADVADNAGTGNSTETETATGTATATTSTSN